MTLDLPTLNDGERYLGAIISADGSKKHHIILLPGSVENKNWQDAMKWAESIGGELPDRTESALLFVTMKDEFEPEWYWTREQHAANSDGAWSQSFSYGGQNYHLQVLPRPGSCRPQISHSVI